PGPRGEIRHFAKQLLDGVFGYEADHFLAVFFAVDEDDEEFDESKWVKANPLIDVNPHVLTAIRKEAVETKAMPSKLAEFRIKRLYRPACSAVGWLNMDMWLVCDGPVDLSFLEGKPCTAGLVLASSCVITS